MSTEPTYASTSAPPARRGIRGGLFFLTIAFIAGIGVMGWALTRWDAARTWLLGADRPAESLQLAPRTEATPPPAAVVPPSSVDQQLVARLAAIETRMAILEASGGAGSGASSSRADALIAAFSARRAIDRGVALGAAEALVTQQFGTSHPREIATIIATARQPVTLEGLRRDLDALSVNDSAGSDAGWWDSITSGLSELVTVRSAESPATDPAARLARAKSALTQGQIETARADVAQLPFDSRARAWVQSAQRYRDVQAALDRIEAAALTPDAQPLNPLPPPPPVAPTRAPVPSDAI